MSKPRHFLSIADLSLQEIAKIITKAQKLKGELKRSGRNKELLKNKTMAMIFEKPSLRTRLSFEIGMTQLNGHAIYLGPSDIGLGRREQISDIAKVTSSMADIIMARTFEHKTIEELSLNSSVPVINALSDLEHPCQILADLMTTWEIKGKLKGLKLAYVGDGENNVAHSLCLGCALMGLSFSCGSPRGYKMNRQIVRQARRIAKKTGVEILETDGPDIAVEEADVVVTDTWVSMGDETEKVRRLKIFKPYQVNQKLMSKARKNAIFMHCLPAYRGNEVASEVIDSFQSVVFQEAENRLHVQKALVLFLLGVGV